jgi:hypothetical protein
MALNVTLDRYSLMVDGAREFILCGAMHYCRLPSKDLWHQRLALIKDAGFNAVDIYYPWNYHTEQEGVYNFDGARDVDYLHRCIEDAGLYLIARPGPYICAEIDAGGLPGWLLAKKDVVLRCRDAHGSPQYDPAFIAYTRQWYEQIVPRILACKNLILFQVENEYNDLPYLKGPAGAVVNAVRKIDPTMLNKLLGADALRYLNFKVLPRIAGKQSGQHGEPLKYFQDLCAMARELGVQAPLFHNDIQSASGRVTEVDFMTIDDYPLNMYTTEWRGKRNTFASTDMIEEGHAAFQRDEPVFIAEFQGGWFDFWGGSGYDAQDKIFTNEFFDIHCKTALAQRATLLSWFMFAGGTSWGYLASPDVYTAYYPNSAISEWGARTEKWYAIQFLARKIQELCPDLLETDPDPRVRCGNSNVDCFARTAKSGRRFVFLRNLTKEKQKARLNFTTGKFVLDPVSMSILVFGADNKLEKTVEPYESAPWNRLPRKSGQPDLPDLGRWTIAWGSPQLAPGFDDSAWSEIPEGAAMDMDSLGHHYGYIWYRGTYAGRVARLRIDARHCFSVFLNGKLVGSRDNFKNRLGAGPDLAETFNITLPESFHNDEENVVVILAESLGHHKDFEADARNPRGIVSLGVSGGGPINWRWRGGLLPGESGLCPVLGEDSFDAATQKSSVSLPHVWEPYEQGIGLYETAFDLGGVLDPERDALGLFIPEAFSKVNIYLNGALVGRYWQEMGPQRKFYLPWGILRPEGDNHLALGVWKRWLKGGLGRVRLEMY